MTLTELSYVVALAQEKHFGRAAERCHVSQPTLSIAVKKQEDGHRDSENLSTSDCFCQDVLLMMLRLCNR